MKTRHVIQAVAFILIFALVLTAVTLIYYPKWTPLQDKGQMAGFYREPENTIDVLLLGSCNMYSSFSPIVMYARNGITSYNFSCPDQEMSTTYHYIKDALKTQKGLKVVVVEALFLSHYSTEKRERYNRFALDYMPLSWNKVSLAWETAKTESKIMPKYDKTASSRWLTFASYIFPILRYHNRTDLSPDDFTYFIEADRSNFFKGGYPLYSYTRNDGNHLLKLFNGSGINETASVYFPKIVRLCEENGIALVVMKSPNYARWGHDDKQTSIVRDYVASFGVPFVDMHAEEFGGFEDYDYGADINLNIYGAKKLTCMLADYLIRQFGLEPTELSEADAAAWQDSVRKYYQRALEKGMDLEPGHVAQLFNKSGAVCVRWNPSEDCARYSIYRIVGHEGPAEMLATVGGETYDDTDVRHGQGYTYYVIPEEGALAGIPSNSKYTVFVDMPTNVVGRNENGSMRLNWDGEDDCYFQLYRRYYGATNFTSWSRTSKHTYLNTDQIKQGKCYTFRLSALLEEDGVAYESESVNVTILPQSTPVIQSVSSSGGKNEITWKPMQNRSKIHIYRAAVGEDADFVLYEKLSGSKTSFTDSDVKTGEVYSYRVSTMAENAGIKEESALSEPVAVVAIK